MGFFVHHIEKRFYADGRVALRMHANNNTVKQTFSVSTINKGRVFVVGGSTYRTVSHRMLEYCTDTDTDTHTSTH